jgi:hypothetical protein
MRCPSPRTPTRHRATADARPIVEPGGETAQEIKILFSAAEDLVVQYLRQTGRVEESAVKPSLNVLSPLELRKFWISHTPREYDLKCFRQRAPIRKEALAEPDHGERRLTTILSADVVGYSRLIAADGLGPASQGITFSRV